MTTLDSPKVYGRPTEHFLERARTRHLSPDVEALILTWGIERRAAGATHLTLLRRYLPPDIRDSKLVRRAEGWILVMGGSSLITCYHREDAWKFVRRKAERRRGRHFRGARA